MSKQPHNPPAFPHPDYQYSPTQEGMSLRDYFAGQSLCGLVTVSDNVRTGWTDPWDVAQWAYRVADAMLQERLKGEKDE